MHKTREARNAYNLEWSLRNKDKIRERHKRWYAARGHLFNERRRAYRAANRAKIKASKDKWDRENPDRVAAAAALAKIRRKQKKIAQDLVWRYKFTLADYEALLTAQGHRCAICGRESGNDDGVRLFVDHDHATGAIRGLLCNRCNSALGYFSDNTKRLRRAIAYLENWRGKTAPDERRGFQPLLGCISEAGSAFKRLESVEETEPGNGTSG